MGSNVKFSILVAAFVLLTISMYGGLSFAVWNLHTQSIAQSVSLHRQSASLKTNELQSLKDENRNQNTKLQSLKAENTNLQNQISVGICVLQRH